MKTLVDKIGNSINSNAHRFYIIAVLAACVVFISFAAAAALAKSPWCDEAWFASPALNLATSGFMGTTILEPAGTFLEGINERTYWIPPVYILAQAAWYKVFGFSLFTMRMMSVSFGLIALISWFSLVKTISGNVKIAVLAVVLIACDYCFIMIASVGRMDMVSAALAVAAFASYMALRTRHFMAAVMAGAVLTAINGFTHPTGVLAFVGLSFLVLFYDRSRLGVRHVVAAAIPFLIGAALWGLYIAGAPDQFLAQFGGNVNGINNRERLTGIASIVDTITKEFSVRYLDFYGLGSESSGPARLKILILAAYAAGVIAAFATSEIRNDRGKRSLLILAAIYFFMLMFLDGHKQTMYLVHIIPMYAAILAASIHHYSRFRLSRIPIALSVVSLLALQLGGVAYVVRQNEYQRSYQPAVDFIKANAPVDERPIMASGEMGFGLEFRQDLIDDWRLGFHSGKRPKMIVVGKQYSGMIPGLKNAEPAAYAHATALMGNYVPVYEDQSTKILVPNEDRSSYPIAMSQLDVPRKIER